MKETIKGVVFDLDNTLLDFMKMKEFAVKAAIKGMIEAGLMIDENQSYKEIIWIYEEFGWENQKVFDVFIEKQIGYVDNKFLAAGIVAYRRAREANLMAYPHLIKLMNNQNLNEYIKLVVGFSFEANKYFNDSKPWSEKTKNISRMNTILFTISEQIKNISILLNPIIPEATEKVLSTINVSKDDINLNSIQNQSLLSHNKELKDLEILFKKVENDN